MKKRNKVLMKTDNDDDGNDRCAMLLVNEHVVPQQQ